MLRRKSTSHDRVGYLKDMNFYLSAFNLAVANQMILLNRSGLNKSIDKLDLILKNSLKKRKEA